MNKETKYHTISLSKEYFKFSCAHFTILGKGLRERVHGHDYFISIDLTYPSDHFIDYNVFKREIEKICNLFDEKIIIPKNSAQLSIEKNRNNIELKFKNDFFSFPRKDVLLIPVVNTTLEELNNYLFKLIKQNPIFKLHKVKGLTISLKNCGQASLVSGVLFE